MTKKLTRKFKDSHLNTPLALLKAIIIKSITITKEKGQLLVTKKSMRKFRALQLILPLNLARRNSTRSQMLPRETWTRKFIISLLILLHLLTPE